MEIKDFDSLRIGSGYPASFDISKIDTHESCGVYANIPVVKEGHRIELRKNSWGEIALFNFKHNDLKLPKGWEDSEILWENK
ncbi:hypothetical protein FDB55_08270 [Clostridium botulinum]|uniref:hypothetical protein n=1 Tax=Clostridium botulinum TaxID=1491 RepID=UPI00077312F0|nr:hypothetical protein [Clostridium botulinum]MBN1074702.1 hypothetical protein [Clostridium botulinum]MCS6110411.1 hypothetical protein [Clostridium botulinum]NFE13791.1 hypothetical protein [Clostridium botulinum]NFG39436.1 hypothetical protein [Clostridium botulinum]NFL41474.1 hypothetical protein [Clostridium botulinum]